MSIGQFTKKFSAGEIIFTEGEIGQCAYLIDQGRVEIFVDKKEERTPLARLGAGEIFGEMAIIDGGPRSASAMAMEDSELTVVSKEQLTERVSDADPVVRLLIVMLLSRVRDGIKEVGKYGKHKEYVPKEVTSTHDLDHLDDKTSKEVLNRIRFESELKEALTKNEFSVHCQPIVDLKDNDVAGFEALMRWNSPTRGLVRPDIFMGIAEESSLIIPMGRWVIKKACEEFMKIKDALSMFDRPVDHLFMSINVSGRQFNDPQFFKILNNATKKYGHRPEQIKLEITERVLVTGNMVEAWIQRCRDYGYTIALDDFGTGYSSLSYLSRLNVNNIKIDKSFVHGMEDDPNTMIIVKSIATLANHLNRPAVAEGIETEKQLKVLKKLGAAYGQGYLFCKPMPVDQLIEFLLQEEIEAAA